MLAAQRKTQAFGRERPPMPVNAPSMSAPIGIHALKFRRRSRPLCKSHETYELFSHRLAFDANARGSKNPEPEDAPWSAPRKSPRIHGEGRRILKPRKKEEMSRRRSPPTVGDKNNGERGRCGRRHECRGDWNRDTEDSASIRHYFCSATLGRHEFAQTVAALRKIRSALHEG